MQAANKMSNQAPPMMSPHSLADQLSSSMSPPPVVQPFHQVAQTEEQYQNPRTAQIIADAIVHQKQRQVESSPPPEAFHK